MESQRLELQKLIEQEIYETEDPEKTIPSGTGNGWLFDFKRIILRAESLDLVGELFWEKCKNEYPFQIGGI